mmetsp:Transcript_111034/g.353817  ORF Transcript_111034/g.353817 Transcript_111034/m.353817 type:complete len:545 (-) Transcript_111034:29-1663(-)
MVGSAAAPAVALLLTLLALALSLHGVGATTVPSAGDHQRPRTALTGAAPLLMSSCTGEVAHVLLSVGGEPFSLIVDTGSSNTEVAASRCSSCSVSPKFAGAVSGTGNFSISFGTGAVTIDQASVQLEIGGLRVKRGSVGVIVEQNTSFGFSVFPPLEDGDCYNSFAGLMGLAYSGQDAGLDGAGGTTNGTTRPLLDQLVEEGMPNAFALEICGVAPTCDAHRKDNSSWWPSSACGSQQVGSLLLGGYSSARIRGPMQFTAITDEVHYDVQLLGVRICGAHGCRQVAFPDDISGRTENDCVCSTADCAPGTVNFCSFTVLDSGADAIYMNSAANARTLLEAMDAAGLVQFPEATSSADRTGFWFNGSAVVGATIAPQAALEFLFAGLSSAEPEVQSAVAPDALFQTSLQGLSQVGLSGNLDLLEQFQKSKFPTLLGGSFFKGKTILFDRSRRRVGFAAVRHDLCRLPAAATDIDQVGADSLPTPGAGCRRGTGSGGGCNRGPWKAHIAQAQRRQRLGFGPLVHAGEAAADMVPHLDAVETAVAFV